MASLGDNALSGFTQGMALAQHAEQVRMQREQLEEQKKELAEKRSRLLLSDLNQAMILPKSARKARIDMINRKAQMLGVPPIPADVIALANDESYHNDLLSGLNHILGSPGEEQVQALSMFFGGDAASLAKTVTHFGEVQAKQAAAGASVFYKNANLDNKRKNTGIREDNQTSAAVDRVVNDSIIKTQTQQISLTDRGISILQRPGLTNQEFNDVAQELTNAIAGAKSAALGKLERTEYTSTQQTLAAYKQKLTGKPTDAVPEAFKARVLNLAQDFNGQLSKHRYERALSLKRNYANNPNAVAEQMRAIEQFKPGASPAGQAPAKTLAERFKALPPEKQKEYLKLHPDPTSQTTQNMINAPSSVDEEDTAPAQDAADSGVTSPAPIATTDAPAAADAPATDEAAPPEEGQ